jgi:hypothetical protein
MLFITGHAGQLSPKCFRLITFGCFFLLGNFTWDLRLEKFRLGCSNRELSLVVFRLGTFVEGEFRVG